MNFPSIPHNLRKPNPKQDARVQTAPRRGGNAATGQTVGPRVGKSVGTMTPKLGKGETRLQEPTEQRQGEEGASAPTKEKEGAVWLLSRLCWCERVHFGLVGAGMRGGSSSVCKRGLGQTPVQDRPVAEPDLCLEASVRTFSRSIRRSSAQTASCKHVTELKENLDVPACAGTKNPLLSRSRVLALPRVWDSV